MLSGNFIITAELSPPKGADTSGMLNDAYKLKDIADAINVTDNQRAIMRMSPVAAGSILHKYGFETIMHMTCRDRNRLALQSELLGAYALGIKNILVMSGDHPLKGDHRGAKAVYDMDSVQLLGMISELNLGYDFSGNKLEGRPDFCVGCVANTDVNALSLLKLEKKIKMGARFIQTQAVFEVHKFSEFMEDIGDIRRTFKVRIIAGVIPLKSEKSARFLTSNMGIKIPEEIIERMRNARNQKSEGMEIAAELIKELGGICDGVHVMPVGRHENTKELLEMAGII